MHILAMVLLLLACWVSAADASCSGSGVTWSCTAGTTAAQVSSTLGSASDGATLTFASGSYSWTSDINFFMTKGATLLCASSGACTVTGSGTLGMNGTCSGTSTKLYRISGFVFSGGGTRVWFNAYSSPPCTLTGIRIDHNTFSGQVADSRIVMFGDNSNNAYFYGVIDNNTLTNSSSVILAEFFSSNGATAPAGTRGTANNMFFENNTMTITTQTNAGAGCIDSTGSPGIVWRFNTTTNCLLTAHGTTHGGGVVNYEVYKNTFTVNSNAASGFHDCYRCFHHQGSGETIFFDNVFTAFSGKSGNAIEMTHYRSGPPGQLGYNSALGQCDGTASRDGNRSPVATYRGYPCWRQPGRDVNGSLQPLYIWKNRWSDSGAKIDMEFQDVGSPNYFFQHFVENRDYYNAVSATSQTSPASPFNGTTGMGFGTLANRPTTCVTNLLEPGGGVGYFASDQGPAGVLYRCSATNTWNVHYIPYTYPHPLRTGAPSSPPSAPSNLIVQ